MDVGRWSRAMRIAAFVGITADISNATAARAQRIFYPEPPEGSVTVMRDVGYARSDTGSLRMDVYRPAGVNAPRPALVMFQGRQPYSAAWARVAAAKGIVTIVPDLRFPSIAQDFDSVTAYVLRHGRALGVDTAAIAVFAGSGPVWLSMPIVHDPRRGVVKAYVGYYGNAAVREFRHDLPMLFVRAGLDRPSMNGTDSSGTVGLAARALALNLPITVINYPGGHHGFELTDDAFLMRDVMDQTFDFIKRATSAAYQADLRRSLAVATAAGHMTSGNPAAAAATYAPLVAQHPEDAALGLSYAEALTEAKQYAAACAAFAPLKGRGLGRRDLGLPAARACLQMGDQGVAMAWLQSIPKRNLPVEVEHEAVFAPLRGRADFQALFRP